MRSWDCQYYSVGSANQSRFGRIGTKFNQTNVFYRNLSRISGRLI